MEEASPIDRHSALVRSRAGRWVVTIAVAIGAAWIVGPNMPAGPFRDDVEAVWEPAIEIGLVQDWGVFSPNPRDQSLDVSARLEFDDGSSTMWEVPEFDPFFGAYRQYRWQKWQERVRLDDRASMWDTTAEWIAGRYAASDDNAADSADVVRVILIRRWIDHEPVGSPRPIDGDWNEFEFHTWEPPS